VKSATNHREAKAYQGASALEAQPKHASLLAKERYRTDK
jgi:hypothetical protein